MSNYYGKKSAFGALVKDAGNCNCIHGTAYIDAHGNCQCDQNQVPIFPKGRGIVTAGGSGFGCPDGYEFVYAPGGGGNCVPKPNSGGGGVNTGKITEEVIRQLTGGGGNTGGGGLAGNGSTTNLMETITNNKWLVLAGILGAGYLFMNAGAKPKSRVVTSESKY